MIQITPQMRVVVAVEPADFRKGIDGLARLCKEALQHDPFGGLPDETGASGFRGAEADLYRGICDGRAASSGPEGTWLKARLLLRPRNRLHAVP